MVCEFLSLCDARLNRVALDTTIKDKRDWPTPAWLPKRDAMKSAKESRFMLRSDKRQTKVNAGERPLPAPFRRTVRSMRGAPSLSYTSVKLRALCLAPLGDKRSKILSNLHCLG